MPSLTASRRGDEGFTIVEVMVAMSVFAILATAFASTLSASLRSLSLSKQRTQAEQLASSQLEETRRIAYTDLGTVGGNPAGVVVPTKTVTTGTRILTVVTDINYVNDKVPTAKETGADYKSVVVTVTSETSVVLARQSSFVAPPTQPSQTDGLMKVRVVDKVLNVPLLNATVNLGGGPDAPISDTTDANGWVSFAALTPTPASGTQSKYTIAVSSTGYQTLPDDVAPAPAASTALATGAIFTTDIHLYKPITMTVRLVDPTGAPFTAATKVALAWAKGADTITVTGGTATVTSVGTSPLIPKVEYTIGASATGFYAAAATVPDLAPSYPSVLTSSVTLVMQPYVSGPLQVTVKDSTNNVVAGLVVVVSDGPGSISVTTVTNSSGVAAFSVPVGIVPVYTISVPQQSPYATASTTVQGPTGATAVSVTLTVQPS